MKSLLGFILFWLVYSNVAWSTLNDSLLNRFYETTNEQEKIIILCEISNTYSQTDFILSRNFAYRAYELSLQYEFNSGLAKSTMSLGYAYDYHAQYDSAVFYYLESLKFYELMHDTLGQSSALNNLGVCYFFSNQLDDALVYYKKSLRLELATKNHQGIADSYNNIAVVYRHTDRIDSAEYYFLEARKIYTQLGNLYGVAGTHLNTGLIAQNRNNLDKAILETKIATNYFIQSENWSDAGNSYNAISELFLTNKMLDSAEFYAQKGYDLNKSNGFNQFLVNSLSIMIALDTLQGNFKNATRHLLEQANVQNYLHENFKDEQIENSRNLYELGSKQKEIFSLQTDNSEKEQTITKKNEQVTNLVLLIFAFGLMFILIVFVLFKLRKANKKLGETNDIIHRNLEEKEWLLKEIHHRVKNNLQIVSSLLNLQTRYITDDGAISAIHDSQERVQAISILHQQIYQNDVLREISARDYFSRLIEAIQNTFDSEKKINLILNLDNKMLDVDQILPIGLILNEMLTNAYKYGTESTHPQITITFKCDALDFELIIADNGAGVKNLATLENAHTLGMKLIQIFAKKMKAHVALNNNNGFEISISGKLKLSKTKNS